MKFVESYEAIGSTDYGYMLGRNTSANNHDNFVHGNPVDTSQSTSSNSLPELSTDECSGTMSDEQRIREYCKVRNKLANRKQLKTTLSNIMSPK